MASATLVKRADFTTAHTPFKANQLSSSSSPLRTTVFFTISDRVGALEKVLAYLADLNVSLTRIESRPSKTKGYYDFVVDCKAKNAKEIEDLRNALVNVVTEVKVISTEEIKETSFGGKA